MADQDYSASAGVFLMAEAIRTGTDGFEFNRFERARIIGARALQIALGAPVLLDLSPVDPVKVAEAEFARGMIPITVLREPAHLKAPRRRVKVARIGEIGEPGEIQLGGAPPPEGVVEEEDESP
jgi:DNA-directed RNA polymerase subunit K